MRTRNSNFPNNSNVTIPRRRNRGRAPNIVEPELRTIVEVAPMAERTMEELLRAPTEGYGEAIVLPSLFINILNGCNNRDLWKVCNDYGTVVDVFIPNKKSKAGKRFAFVRFIKRCLSKHAMGKVKDVNSIPNLRTILMDEGFSDVKLMYLGDAVHDFVSDERIVWVDIEGIPLNVWSRENILSKVLTVRAKELFTWNLIFFAHKETVYTSEDEFVHSPKKGSVHSSVREEASGDDSESDVEEVSETIFGDNSSSPINNSDEMSKQHSEDPFKIYDILKKQTGGETREVSSSLSHPPGFTPEVSEIRKENVQGAEECPSLVNAKVMNNSQEVFQDANSESVDPNVVKEGGSVLEVLEDMIRVGQAMGYTMDGCVKDLERIIGTQGADDVHR
ncbi:RNA-directed DNA polymerase, eukaryota [Tanacetum coccineum]